ncbi:MAG: hypothetical protein HY717_05320 [Planctomycetes bacterium]|nr:hypothetical protein [Planctomycetota bacterium]
MNKNQTLQISIEDEKLGLQMVKDRLITEAQLNTASDFQRAIGGRLEDLIVRLGFVNQTIMDKFIENYAAHLKGDKPKKREAAGAKERAEGRGDVNEKTANFEDRPLRGTEGREHRPLGGIEGGEHSVAAAEAVAPSAAAPGSPRSPAAREGKEAADSKEAAKISTLNETAIVLEALLRILVRKGVIESTEIKEEIRRL